MLKAPDDVSTLFPSDQPDPWTMRVTDPLPLGGDPAVTTAGIAMLRDASARFSRVLWSAEITGPVDIHRLMHLYPPTHVAGPAELGETWKEGYRYGSFYYRLGPSFIVVKDTRESSAAARFVIDDPNLCDVFLRCATPLHNRELTAPQRDAAEPLIDEGLLFDISGWLVTAPLRMLRWPVPAHDI